MHPNDLTEAEHERFIQAMETVHRLDQDERIALIEHAVATSIRYATTPKLDILDDWAKSLLGTLRMHASKVVQDKLVGPRSSFTGKGLSAAEVLAVLRR